MVAEAILSEVLMQASRRKRKRDSEESMSDSGGPSKRMRYCDQVREPKLLEELRDISADSLESSSDNSAVVDESFFDAETVILEWDFPLFEVVDTDRCAKDGLEDESDEDDFLCDEEEEEEDDDNEDDEQGEEEESSPARDFGDLDFDVWTMVAEAILSEVLMQASRRKRKRDSEESMSDSGGPSKRMRYCDQVREPKLLEELRDISADSLESSSDNSAVVDESFFDAETVILEWDFPLFEVVDTDRCAKDGLEDESDEDDFLCDEEEEEEDDDNEDDEQGEEEESSPARGKKRKHEDVGDSGN
ncbi:RNA polymerase-associated protein LEO1-like [Bombus flavifrons]|uniref:RNA polymerase-associated protein LEO1-like n=1 Tax=Bombus flavifrons TaxID=103934 RepID=UPI003704C481